jgi:hypothetical protein
MKVSFDFDGTLEREDVQEYAAELIAQGLEVHVTTTRYDEENIHLYASPVNHRDLYNVMNSLKLPLERIKFTNMEWKHTYLATTDFLWHLDDNIEEITRMTRSGDYRGICVVAPDWKKYCNLLIKRKMKGNEKVDNSPSE